MMYSLLPQTTMKRPLLFAVPIILVMIAMIIPLGKLSLGGISEKYLPPTNSVRLAQEEFDRTFPGFRTEPITLVIQNKDGAAESSATSGKILSLLYEQLK